MGVAKAKERDCRPSEMKESQPGWWWGRDGEIERGIEKERRENDSKVQYIPQYIHVVYMHRLATTMYHTYK